LRGLPVDDDYGDADDGGALEYEDVNEWMNACEWMKHWRSSKRIFQ
jgi:hypothetical protein